MRFDGFILGAGTTSGTRLVVGHWLRTPFGPFSDVMVQRPDGHRLLLAPDRAVADFIAGTYTFDEIRIVPVAVHRAAPAAAPLPAPGRGGPAAGRGDRRPDPADGQWTVAAGPLVLRVRIGRRPALGWLLRAVPAPLARTPAWIGLLDRPARLLTGLRTRGSAGNARTEYYGVQDLRSLTALAATWDGEPLGSLAPVDPPVTFGFGSVPPSPAVVRVRTTITGPAD